MKAQPGTSDIRLMTLKEAAERLGVCVHTLRLHVSWGDIKYILIGKRTRRFTQADLEEFIENQKQQVTPPSLSGRRRSSLSGTRTYDFEAERRERLEQRAQLKKKRPRT